LTTRCADSLDCRHRRAGRKQRKKSGAKNSGDALSPELSFWQTQNANRLAYEESNCSPQEIPKRADKSQVERIRKEIHERGECIIKRGELHTLWIRELNTASELDAIWALSAAEHWSFTLSPNGDVRFASLISN
jgi:hypothetical protein